ncbi:MAG: hypothetical protein E6Q91_03930 [Actinobacteria bacterium]|nr:MAG: hypothetical protein E6Q91_03930 [Actinomycetota bacterium]
MPEQPRILRAMISGLLVVEAILVVHPMLAVSNFFVGSGVLGKALAHVPIPDVIAQGVGYLLSPLVVLLLLLAAWGVAHRTRGIGALILQPTVAVFAGMPILRPMGVSAPALAVVAAVTTVLLIVLIVRTRRTDATHRRWWWLAGYVTAAFLLAAFNASSTALPFDPTAALTSSGGGGPGRSVDLPEQVVPQNPSVAANPFNSIHNDTWATDSYNLIPPKEPLTAKVESLFTGGDCATITFNSRGELVTLCSTLTKVVAYLVDPASLRVVESRVVGERRPSLTDFSGGGYFILDAKDQIVFPARGGILRIIEAGAGLSESASIDVSATLQPGEQVTSVMPDWEGRYWYVGALGTVGVVRDGKPEAINLDGEDIENSFALAEEGAYVATGAAIYRLEAGPTGPPEVAWRTAYDAGSRQKPGQTSRATGTTPTLFEGGVAITDNADPQMNVVVYERDSGTLRCQAPVFTPGTSATENSLIAIDGALIVENNYGYKPAVLSTTAGNTTEPGLAAIETEDCSLRWSNDEIHIPSLVSKATTAGGLVLTYTKPPSALGTDAWYFTAVDAGTGQVYWTRRAGAGTPFNNHYAAAYLSANGDMFVGTLNGLVVLRSIE